MIAKLIVYGDNREQAIARMSTSLDEFIIRGVKHNIAFLGALIANPLFASGAFNPNFINQF